jgi:hypothetical protein
MAGAIRASSNNVIQFASLLGPMAGTIAAVVGTGIALWADYSAKQQKATDDLEKFKQELSGLNKVWGEIESRASQFRSSLEGVASVESVNSVDSFRSAWQSNERSIAANNYAVRELNKEYDSLQKKIKAAQDIRNEKFSYGQEDAVVEDEKRIAELEKKAQELREKRTETANRGLDLSRKRRLLEEKEESIFMQQQLKDQIALSDAQKAREQKAAEEKRKSDDKIKREQDKATAKAEQDAKSLASLQQSLTSDIKTPEKQIENVMTKLEERQKKINELATSPEQAAAINLEAIDAATRELERVKDEQNQSLQFAGAAEFGSTEAYARSLQTENKSVSENTKQLVDLAKEQLKEARKKKETELQEASF